MGYREGIYSWLLSSIAQCLPTGYQLPCTPGIWHPIPLEVIKKARHLKINNIILWTSQQESKNYEHTARMQPHRSCLANTHCGYPTGRVATGKPLERGKRHMAWVQNWKISGSYPRRHKSQITAIVLDISSQAGKGREDYDFSQKVKWALRSHPSSEYWNLPTVSFKIADCS